MNRSDLLQYALLEGAYEYMEHPELVRAKAPLFARVSAFLRHDRTLRFIGGYLADVFTTIILLLAMPHIMLSSPILLVWAGMISAIIVGILVQIIHYFNCGEVDIWRIRWLMVGSLPVVFLRSILILVLWI